MSPTMAAQMTGADLLKLRKKRGTMIWALVLALAPVLIFFIVHARSSTPPTPAKYGPAGGIEGYHDGVRLLALLLRPAGRDPDRHRGRAGDASAGVFRDLVVTGRSRLALFASRVPAALAICWA